MSSKEPHHVIAIGASAGGMEEINIFFDHTPLDGVSYVIVQHLSPDFKSRMIELLARHSKLVVNEAKNGMKVKCNEVYLIPNDKFMTIKDGRLHLTAKEKVKGPHLTINTFFSSLAADCGVRAIGVILSGLGSDGTEGVKAIKKAGGMVIARNPENTSFNSMPSHAIATGMVDFVLEPESMPAIIEDYAKYEGKTIINSQDDEQNIAAIINLIKEQSPLDFSDYKQTTILRRTTRRAAYNNFTTLDNYLEFLKETPAEVEALAQDFLIGVTSFFRDKEAFGFLDNNIIPAILKNLAKGEEMKLWVAGCSTGEEAYSMAILVAEHLVGKYKDTVVKIFATDIDSIALVNAGKGIYHSSISKNVSAERLERFFLKEGDEYRIKTEIRRMVIFAQHDLVKNPPYCNMHFISCRNLLIYMTPILQKKIFTMMLFGLKMEGYLFLGSSENPMPIIRNLEVINKKYKIYKNLQTKRVLSLDTFSLPGLLDIKHTPSVLREEVSPIASSALAETVCVSQAYEHDLLIVCVDESHHVVKTYGDTSKYLLQKNFTLNLVDLLPRPLAIAFNNLISKTLKTNEKSVINSIKVKQDEAIIHINLSVSPIVIKKDGQKLLMVTFSENKSIQSAEHTEPVFDEKFYLDQYTQNLEEELKELKDKLHSAYEQLDASNENMQSFNEELISANEEMQSTNEEMQSVNEELHTINSDYQLKNKELVEINDDLNNYFRSNVNGQLFINDELQLMKFSPAAVKQINLLDSDVGRPLSHISTNIKFETIINDIKKVLTEGTVISKEIETNNGQWYQIMTMPYIQEATNKKNGAIITFNDITELKQAQLELDKKNKALLRVNADLDHFIHAASHDLLAPLGNIETSINVMNHMALSDSKLLEFLNIINLSIKNFRMLIVDIASIAKVEGDMKSMERVDMDDIMNNIVWSLEDKIKASGAMIIRDFEIKKIFFSKKNLRSIVYNLVSNALKFKRDIPPVIHIRITQKDDDIILTVQDNGKGIDQDGIDRIFDMYGRLNQNIEGHGIGLYLARKIVNAANGNITVESKPGKGSKFTIYIKAEVHQP